MPAKMMSEIPLPIPRSVICSPSHMMKAVPAVSVMTVIMRKPQPVVMTMEAPDGPAMFSRPTAIPKPWMRRKDHRPVAGVLGDLAAPRLAFLGEPLQVRNGDREQLQDDGGADVGHDPQRKHRQVRERPSRKQVEEPEERPLRLVEKRGERRRVDAGRGHMGPDPVDGQQQECEGDPLLELRDLLYVFQSADQIR